MEKFKSTHPKLWQTIAVNAAGLLGYALFLFGLLGVLSLAGLGLLQLLPMQPGDPAPVQHPTPTAGTPDPILQVFIALIGLALFLILGYFFFVRLGTKIIQNLAKRLKTSVWVIKFTTLPLSWLLIAFCISFITSEPRIQLAAFGASIIFTIIGLVSFALEYGLMRLFKLSTTAS